jgi:hypothetical protein
VQLFASFGALRNFTTLFLGRAESVQVLLSHYLLDENVGSIEHRNISLRCSPYCFAGQSDRLVIQVFPGARKIRDPMTAG